MWHDGVLLVAVLVLEYRDRTVLVPKTCHGMEQLMHPLLGLHL